MVHLKTTVLAGIAAAPSAYAWGSLGHTTVAYIAQNLVSADTKKFAQTLLSDTTDSYLANVATWADSYRYTTAGEFSAPYHFIDALDSPPKTCGVNYDRDCPASGCIVSAIANYSVRAVDTSLSLTEQQKAFKWIVHFVGDIHQPLHVENLDVGGNTINVTFGGAVTNLHATWDTAMPQKYAGAYTLANAKTWATTLTTAIKTGTYKTAAKTWTTGLDAKTPIDTAMLWANDANAYVCSTVLPNGVAAVKDKELDAAYYTTALPVIKLQIAKAGYRLAAWLDAVVANNGVGVDQGADGQFGLSKREFAFENWQLDAKARRVAFGDDCGCGEDHHH